MHINLLPYRIQQQNRRRLLLQILAAVQVVIFLSLIGAIFYTRAQERNAMAQSAGLLAQIAALDRAPIEAYEAARQAARLADLTYDFIQENFPPAFDPLWFDVVRNAVPPGIQLLTLSYEGTQLTLTATAHALQDIGTHQQFLLAAAVFETVLLGATSRQPNGRTLYELRLILPG